MKIWTSRARWLYTRNVTSYLNIVEKHPAKLELESEVGQGQMKVIFENVKAEV